MSESTLPGLTSTTSLLASRSPSPRPNASRSISYGPRRRGRRSSPPIHLAPALLTFLLFAAVVFMAWDVSSYGNCYVQPVCRILGTGKDKIEDVWWRNAGAYAPWKSLGAGGGKINLPRGCVVDQVNILHRHAARFPTTGAAKNLEQALEKLKYRQVQTPRRHTELAFLSKADLNMKDSGAQGRVIETSGYWLQGLLGKTFKLTPMTHLDQVNLILPEETTFNNTLSVHSCPAYEFAPSSTECASLEPLIQPIADRLNALLRPDPPLLIPDIIALADMCPYDSQAVGEDWEGWSRWCGIFYRDEWEILGHYKDVDRYFSVGQGSTYGKTLGAGWMNELIARLTDSPVRDETSTNRTLDGDETTFPIGGKRVFVDFTHDSEIIEILTAMNIVPQHRPPPTNTVPAKRTYMISKLIPFAARVVVERIGCDLADWEPDPNEGDGGEGRSGDGRKDYVRIFINDEVHAMRHVACDQSGFVEHKMCELDSFLETQNWAMEEVDWGVCYRD